MHFSNKINFPAIFTIDVEDWFHILDIKNAPDITSWDLLPSHVEKNFLKLLNMFDSRQIKVTCFFLGWVAERFPELVKRADQHGHEIASHGYAHRLVYQMSENEFYEDAVKAKIILENIIGRTIIGYRCSGFSVTEATPWFFDKLIEAGYKYDSSVFPATRQHGGMKDAAVAPYKIDGKSGSIIEIPITVARVLGRPLCFFGGGYLRLFPYCVIKGMAKRVLDENRPVLFYVHPREIDPNHPKLPMNSKRKFKSYVNLKTTENKIIKIAEDFKFTTCEQYSLKHRELFER